MTTVEPKSPAIAYGHEVRPEAATDGRPQADELLVTAADDTEPVLSVVLPTKNEKAGISACLDRVKAAVEELGLPTEIIVSDSSTDHTPMIARENGATVIVPERSGYGAAYRAAFEIVRGEYVVIGDADMTYDFTDIPRLFDRLRTTDADIVLGSRLDGEIKPGAMPSLHQYLGNPLLTAFLNTFYGAGVSDAHSGFRILTRSALETLELTTDGMEFASEMLMEAAACGLVIEEVPITYHERRGEATLESFRDGWRHVRFMLVNAPSYLFSIPGLGLGLVGVVLMGLVAFDVSVGELAPGTRSMIAGGLLVLVGYQIASFSVFSTIATDPIRRPTDRITTWLTETMTLERGATVGLAVGMVGAIDATRLVLVLLTDGYGALPAVERDLVAFMLLLIGLQTVFASFFVDLLRADSPDRNTERMP